MVTHRQPTVRGAVSSEHIVQLFDAPESMAGSVAAFLQEGVEAGARLLVAAKASHLKQISAALEHRGSSVADLAFTGQLITIDARATLRSILRNGTPDMRLFNLHIGDLVARLAGASDAPVRVYGELVEILAEEANFRGAQELEDLWNRLGTVVPFTLMCGYSSAHFAAPDAGAALQHICRRHTRVHQSHSDMLGNWLLDGRETVARLA